ncbi:MAG: hypothetical protein Q8N03_12040, partial [Ignavibacteria bacterium]|nr:hypothetical protein [Ignavibacteria bacterium]
MKKVFSFFAVLFLVSSLFSQQEKFIIGVDWLNPIAGPPATNFQPLSGNYWDTAKSLGINYAALNIGEQNYNGVQLIRDELTKAADRDIKIFLYTYKINWGTTTGRPRRWMYQTEDNYDFGSHGTGVSVHQPPVNGMPEPHWSQVNVDEQAPNFLRLTTGIHPIGYAAEDLINDNEIPDNFHYDVKIRIRKTVSQGSSSVPVLKVVVINKTNELPQERTIFANELQQNVWKEVNAFRFYKSEIGPFTEDNIEEQEVMYDELGILGVPDFTIVGEVTNTAYEIKVYWYGQVSCDIDYIAIDDNSSNNLHTGIHDNLIATTVNNFKDHPGLGNIKVADEPEYFNFLPVRYMNEKVQSYLNGGYEDKHALSFNNGRISQRYLAQTKMKVHLADVYPIFPSVPEPGTSNYTNSIQDQFQDDLVSPFLLPQIDWSNIFSTPYWFTPQAHSWTVPALREPSAYEIKAMVNLSVCYGAKGIHYFMFSQPKVGNNIDGHTLLDDNLNGPLPRYYDNYGYEKWNILKTLNHKLSNIGNELLKLKWTNGFSIHQAQPICKYITNIESCYLPSSEGMCAIDPTASTYVELGLFKKADESSNPNIEH